MDNSAYISGVVLENRKVSAEICLMVVGGNFKGQPGQFYMIKMDSYDPFLPRPMSIFDMDDDTISFLYHVTGKGTEKMKNLRPGSKTQILGPLGKGFELKDEGKVALVGGGIGIAPLFYLAKRLRSKPDIYFGFRDKSYLIDQFKPYVNDIVITTDTGEEGFKGVVTQHIDSSQYDVIYCCGPTPMMEAMQKVNESPTLYLSLESHMSCGIGACLGCTCQTIEGLKRVCHEGPVFDGSEVVFE